MWISLCSTTELADAAEVPDQFEYPDDFEDADPEEDAEDEGAVVHATTLELEHGDEPDDKFVLYDAEGLTRSFEEMNENGWEWNP